MEKDMRDCWVDKLIGLGRNFIVWQHGDVVGHAAVIPDFDRGDGEFIIFVSEPNRNRGLGTALTALAIDVSRAAGLKRLWLTVESFNFRAIRLYRKAGFVFVNQSEREMTMLRTL
jgi:RimJ/RimL family protein N-acetyltransferase